MTTTPETTRSTFDPSSTKVSAVLITREDRYPTDIALNFPFDEVIVNTRCPNVKRRFDLAQQARNEVIYVQDDDAEIDIALLASYYDGRMTHAITPGHAQIYRGTGVTLIGWGCFFRKSMIDWSKWEAKYGDVDEMEADRIFTYFAHPHNSVLMSIRQIHRATKMCERPGHYQTKERILRMLKEIE